MATRIEKRVNSSRVLSYGLLLGISSAALFSGYAFAQSDIPAAGAPTPSADGGDLTYDQALQELMRTQEHSKAASSWGEPRRIEVPKGANPDQVIQKELIKVPGLMGLDTGSPDPSKVEPIKVETAVEHSAPTPVEETKTPVEPTKAPQSQTKSAENGGWDWVDQNAKPAAQESRKPALTTVFDSNSGAGQEKVQPAAISQEAEAVDLSGGQSAEAPAPSEAAAPEQAQAPEEEEGPPKTAADVAKDAINIYNNAVKFHLSGKLEEAITAYREALNANPELSQAHCNLGLIFNQQHDYAKALTEFRKALAIDPKDAITYNGIGAALRAQKDMEGAIKNWKTAVTIDPHLATAHYNLGTVFEIQKDYDKALESYAEATKNDFRLGEAYYRMGLILAKKNRIEDAKEQFSKALQVSKNAEYCEDARKRLALIEQGAVK